MTADVQRPPAPPGSQRFVVARADEIPEGDRLIVEAGGRKIGIFNLDGAYHAILYLCPHSGGPLCEGQLVEHVYAERPGEIQHDPGRRFLTCPWHGWMFDLESGQSWSDPRRVRARRFPVAVQRGDTISSELIPGPYVVDKFPVAVEDEYLVVTMRPRTERSQTDASL